MGSKTKIDWCDSTVNPVVGCTYGCEYCYARKMNTRFKWIKDFAKPQFFAERLNQIKSKTPKIIFMNSVSDFADWEVEWVRQVFAVMKENPQHKYLFLTKRPKFYESILTKHTPSNWWFGVTMEKPNTGRTHMVHHSVNVFISIEPIQEPFGTIKPNTDWIIVGAETGNRKGKVIPKKEWIDNIVTQCKSANVPVFMKESLRTLMGDDFVQEFPEGLKKQ